jgi:antitoxin (DNA-binding transcriptional repressor) of toxin-antitoxin stability system
MNASTFKAQCLALFDEIAETGQPVQILKHGKPVAVVSAPTLKPSEYPQAQLRGQGRVLADLIEPPLPADVWETDAAPKRKSTRLR